MAEADAEEQVPDDSFDRSVDAAVETPADASEESAG
jgi:hypothetical protein